MNKAKEFFITGFALFALFFGSGDLILPSYLGFVIAVVAIPLLGLFVGNIIVTKNDPQSL